MSLINYMTPKEIVGELDKYIVGQESAKKAVAIALRNRYRRSMVSEEMREEIIPKNILMMGPTGCGKTEIARRLAKLARAPFIKVEATKFTEVGYVGRDVDSMVRDLVARAVAMLEAEKIEEVKPAAEKRAIERILDVLEPPARRAAGQNKVPSNIFDSLQTAMGTLFPNTGGNFDYNQPQSNTDENEINNNEESDADKEMVARKERIKDRLREKLLNGDLDNDEITIEVSAPQQSPFNFLGGNGMEEMGIELGGMFGNMLPKKMKKVTVTVREAKKILTTEEAMSMIDQDALSREAVIRAENHGIIFIDEMDKICGKDGTSGPSVSREGVQRDILPIIEGSTVNTKSGPVSTNHILFIAAGAFHVSKPSDLIPELQGRLPIRVELESLTKEDFQRILREPKNALTKQYVALMRTEGMEIEFTEDGIDEIASMAAEANSIMENIGARRLHTILEKLLEEISFNSADDGVYRHKINADYVKEKLGKIVADDDLNKYIL